MGQSWFQILFLVIALGSPVISWLFGKLRQKAGEKREQARLQRLREEELRTGRRLTEEQPTPLVPAKNDRASELQRLAERRQQQLRELRARQAQQQQRQAKPANAASQLQSQPKNLPSRSQSRAEQARQRMQERLQQRQQELRKRQEALQQRRQQQQSRPSTNQPFTQPPRPQSQSSRKPDADQIKAALARSAQTAALNQATIQQHLRTSPTPSAQQTNQPRERKRRNNVGGEVRDLLLGSPPGSSNRPSLSALLAVSEVLSKPVSMRDSDDGGGITL
ncbi:MAG: hypothetical protein ACIAQF_08180 [Phycisphaerales bacterium JB065]